MIKFFTILLIIIRCNICISQNAWTPTNGPYGGSCYSLKYINNEVYATTDCGIYSTNDNGISWKEKSAGLGECKIMQDIEQINNTLIAGALDSGIYVSNDFGNNWVKSNTGLPGLFLDQHVYDVFVNGSDVLIGTANGVYKSSNLGNTWTPSNIGINESVNINAVKFIKNGSIIFVGTQSDIYKSTDNGFTWIDMNNTIGANVLSLVALNSNLYVAGNSGIYKSTNNGTSWSLITTNLPGIPTKIFESGSKLYCSLNSSTYVSINGGTTWSLLFNKEFETFLDANNKVFTGSNGGVYSWNNGSSTLTNSGLGGSSATNVIFQDGNTIYSGNNNGIYKTTDNGNTWQNLGLNLPLNVIVNCITKIGNTLIIGTKGYGVYKSSDNGNTWTQSNSGLTLGGVFYSNINSLFQYNGRLFMGAKENVVFYNYATLFISDNNGQSWVQSATGLGANFNISSICNFGQYIVIGTKSEFIPASFNDGVYLSTDNGASWFFDGLSEPINAVCSNTNGYFAASTDVAHSTMDMGNSWDFYDFDSGSSFYIIKSLETINNAVYAVTDIGSYKLNSIGNWDLLDPSGLSGGGAKGICSNSSGTLFLGRRAVKSYGNSYYEVLNGVSKFIGNTSGLDVLNYNSTINLFPNPTTSKFVVQGMGEMTGTSYFLVDQIGNMILSGTIETENMEIDLSRFSEGIYWLKFDNSLLPVQKIIKQ